MISVIVPVYNVEPYLRKCLDSIASQTYQNLEILIIDDGSTDGSGEICDEYKKDERVKVFHTDNRGLSCARNLGLDNATGDWIGFVDSDDWIEPDMYEMLLERAEETGADVVECGWYRVFPNRIVERKRNELVRSGITALSSLAKSELSDVVWNKIWKANCFLSIRFPEGRLFEDIATTYRIFSGTKLICSIDSTKYHYRAQRNSSITNVHNIDNLKDWWQSHKERFDYMYPQVDKECKMILLKNCAEAATRTWAFFYDCPIKDRELHVDTIREIHNFVRLNFPVFGMPGWDWQLRIGIVFPHYYNKLSLGLSWMIGHLYRIVKDKRNAV